MESFFQAKVQRAKIPSSLGAAKPILSKSQWNDPAAVLHRRLSNLERPFQIREAGDLGSFVHWNNNKNEPIHRWLKYREAYSPALIDKLSLGRRILDPFSGCGSILVGAATRGRSSLGIDLNPLATFSTQVKLSPLTNAQLLKASGFLRQVPASVGRGPIWPVPALSIARKVFEPEILDAVLRLRASIQDYSASDERLENFLVLAWLSILEKVGSFFKEGNGIKYRNKKRHIGRYSNRTEGEWQLSRFGSNQKAFVAQSFGTQLQLMLSDAVDWKQGAWERQKVVHGSAFDLTKTSGRRRFDSVIFSPPYANRFDYFESFKVELWFGGFSKSYEDLTKLRKSSMRSHLGADLKRPAQHIPQLEELIGLMDQSASSWRMGVPNLLRGYFDDLALVLRQCKQVAPDGRTFVVVGNSAFAGVVIPTDALTAMLARAAGFKSASILQTRHLTVAPQQRRKLAGFEAYMRESIVVLE